MIISRTPFRVSFFGGGSDYPSWYRENGGAVLAATIDKYCYLSCRFLPPFFEHRIRVVYSKIETCQRAEEIVHPAVRGALQFLGIERGVEIHHDGDLPARSGMGSSSSFAVGILHALHGLEGRMASKEQLAKEAINLEQNILKENVGSQDQVAAAYGGFNMIAFSPGGEITVRPVTLQPERLMSLQSHLMLFYTGIMRTSSDIAATFIGKLAEKEKEVRAVRAMVDTALGILESGDIEDFGRLLDEAWRVKRGFSASVSNEGVDAIYADARAAGALGGKLLGAGGGGFMLLFAPPDRHHAIREKLDGLLHIPFEFEYSGSHIAFYDPERDYSAIDEYRRNHEIQSFRELTQ